MLSAGYVPSINSGKSTRQYKIATKDIVAFLVEYEKHPEKFSFPNFSSKNSAGEAISFALPTDKLFNDLLMEYYLNLLCNYPDLLTVTQAADMLGYSENTVRKWIREEKFLTLKRGTLIPKKTFIPFVTGHEFANRRVKSEKHQSQLTYVLQVYET